MSTCSVGADHCRVTPPEDHAGAIEQVQFVRHLFAYSQASHLISPIGRVLEVGSGEGYGADYLACEERAIVATDVSLQSLRHLTAAYPRITRRCQATGSELPFKDDTFDAVVSFQVIEHLSTPVTFLREIRRVLKPSGQVILTTPNRRLRLLPFQRPWNPYHVHEYVGTELDRLLGKVFRRRHVWGVMATPDVMLLEKIRLRQRPIVVYGDVVKRLIRALCPPRWVGGARRLDCGSRRYAPGPQPFTGEGRTIGVEDFFLSSDCDRSLDLFVEATKGCESSSGGDGLGFTHIVAADHAAAV